MTYLKDIGFTDEEISIMSSNLEPNVLEKLKMFPLLVKTNFNYVKDLGASNYKDIFMNHAHMFLINPDRFKAIFEKYDHADLIRCLEKNAAVIEKL